MKKYLLAALTFIVGFILFVLIHVFLNVRIGGILSFVLAGILFGATGFVYRKFRDEENLKNYGTTDLSGVVLNSDQKGFKEALRNFDFNQSGIEEFIVVNGKEGVSDFVIGIRTKENIKPDYEQIKKELYKTFYPQIKFVFININEMGEGSRGLFSTGMKIK